MRIRTMAWSLGFAGCTLAGPSGPVRVPLDQDFTLRVGDSVEVAGAGFIVSFVSVPADSRCPATVQCVWQGDGAVAVLVGRSGGDTSLTLHTTLDPKLASVAPYTLKLIDLAPGSAPSDVREYAATLRVATQ